MKIMEHYEILKNEKLTSDVYSMELYCPDLVKFISAGQFVNLYTERGEYLLPRPISICEIRPKENSMRLVYRIIGKGTEIFSKLKKGDTIKMLAPLGKPFPILDDKKRVCIVGGGIGVPPMLELAKTIQSKYQAEINVFTGFRTEPILTRDFTDLGINVKVATDDGSFGYKGNVVELIKQVNRNFDIIYACGPNIMLKAISKFSHENKTLCYVSLEERMGCGIGTCVGCVVKIKDGEDFVYTKICKDGTVFNAEEVVWNGN